jgi:hypothetical protein
MRQKPPARKQAERLTPERKWRAKSPFFFA